MLKIPIQYKSLKFIRPISWEEIFACWKKGEAWQESWQKHWKERGFSSWDQWREAYASPLSPKNLDWFLFEIENPLEDLPNFFGVPSRGWIEKAYNGEKTKQLKNILTLPIVSENPKILNIKNNFPEETMLTGIVFKNKIILYEGQHRSCAIASWDKYKPFKSKVSIALANWKESELPIVGANLKK